MQKLILSEETFRHFWEVNMTVVEMNIESGSMPSPLSGEDRLNQGYHNMLCEVLRIKLALWRHQIENVEAADALNTR
jgi:hypothetical protein